MMQIFHFIIGYGWSGWSSWGGCSDRGQQTRYRSRSGPDIYNGIPSSSETDSDTKTCAGKYSKNNDLGYSNISYHTFSHLLTTSVA